MIELKQFVVIYVIILLQFSFSESGKKGYAVCPWRFLCSDFDSYGDASWWYDWGNSRKEYHKMNCTNPPRLGYVSMIYNEPALYTAVIPQDVKYLLGFNEPNVPHQSNLTVQRVVELWPMVEKLAVGRVLVSPALGGCDYRPDECIQWFDDFFTLCKSCRIDIIALHSYSCEPQVMVTALERISKRYNRPIWLTEFSCHGNVTVEVDMNFMKAAIPLLEKSPFVQRYSWYCSRVNKLTGYMPNFSTDLLQQNSSKPTKLGELYNSL